ncbi:hypothetical protein [Bradyrhizobium glycinis]|uniref:hypothetical protein n=1 Tax=Bradyrhizobium glycinis TaxID=2751812 RepID=UPI0018D8F4EE|nr:hypothetical protein [Bradyrhizobium glycinis]MBH5372196.1 hypothetical protein [Bradyrhizobium glycinis]
MVIDIEHVEKWPVELLDCLSANYGVLYRWQSDQNRPSGADYDRSILDVNKALQPHSMIGWHCTRLTDEEIASICSAGLSLPNATVLHARIDTVVSSGRLPLDVATSLKVRNQAHEPNRAGRLWFCFFVPSRAGE